MRKIKYPLMLIMIWWNGIMGVMIIAFILNTMIGGNEPIKTVSGEMTTLGKYVALVSGLWFVAVVFCFKRLGKNRFYEEDKYFWKYFCGILTGVIALMLSCIMKI